MHARNRDEAVRAITHKNALQELLQAMEDRLKRLERALADAERRHDEETARKLRAEVESSRRQFAEARQQLEDAVATADSVKRSIQDKQRQIRERTADALARKSELRNRDITEEMFRRLGTLPNHSGQPPAPLTEDERTIVFAVFVLLSLALFCGWVWQVTQ